MSTGVGHTSPLLDPHYPLGNSMACSQFNYRLAEYAPMRKKYRIELSIEFKDQNRHEDLRPLILQAARDLLGTAQLIADYRPPQVAVQSDDLFYGTDEINLLEDLK